jgi:hypothetical protein
VTGRLTTVGLWRGPKTYGSGVHRLVIGGGPVVSLEVMLT